MGKKKMINWIIAGFVAVFYLLLSFIFDIWSFSWLIWVFYAIYRFIIK